MATPRVGVLAFLRDYKPFDANIDNGRVVVFCVPGSTVTFPDGSVQTVDDNSVVLPNHAAALPRAFVGIMQGDGAQGNPYVATPIDLLSDNTVSVQKNELPEAALKPNTAIQIGDPVGYDPADPGYVQKHVDGTTVYIGTSQTTVSAAASVQLILIELCCARDIPTGMISEIVAPGAAVTNTVTETVLATKSIPAALLIPGRKLRVRGLTNVSGVNSGDKLIVAGYFHKTSVAFNGSGSIKFFTTPTAGGGTAVNLNDQVVAEFDVDLHSATKAVFAGARSIGALGTASLISDGKQDEQTVDLSVPNSISITATWNAAQTADVVSQTAFSVELV